MTGIDVSGFGEIKSLKGVEYFTGLTVLDCNYNQLTALDISKNTALTELACTDNQLTALDISSNTNLTELICYNNPGDGVSKFPVTAWFDNDGIPTGLFTTGKWPYEGTMITVDYRLP